MAIDLSIRRSRRVLLAGWVGSLAAVAASALARPRSTDAAVGDPVLLGMSTNDAGTATTKIETMYGYALHGDCAYDTGLRGDGYYLGVIGHASWSQGGVGVEGLTTSVSGKNYGVWGQSNSSEGRGVYGYAAAGTGSTCGVFGTSASASGRGVEGSARTGVYGSSTATTGIGVEGFASAVSGSSYGVRGAAASTDGRGVYGHAGATSGKTYGVDGWSSSTSGTGVRGVAGAATGTTYGVAAESASTSGIAVRAWASAKTGGTTGAFAQSDSPNGRGVYGYATASTGPTAGVIGQSNSPYGGTGVYGYAHAASGSTFGTFGHAESPASIGALGWSKGGGTGVVGVAGHANATPPFGPAKTGVYGYAVQDASSRGLHGYARAGRGVYGQATTGVALYGYASSGTAVHAATSDPLKGYAIRAVGRVRFDHCAGVTMIPAGAKSAIVKPGIDLTSTSAVVATLQNSAGGTTTVHRCPVDPTANAFTIVLTAKATTAVNVAWHVFG